MKIMNEKETYVRQLNEIALPLIVQYLTTFVIGLTDQAMIGRISVEAYGAVGIINSFNSMVLGVVGCTAVIFNIEMGKKIGHKNSDEWQSEFMSAILLGMFIGLITSAAIFLGRNIILKKIYGFDGKLLNAGQNFFICIAPYALLQMELFIFGQYYKIMQRTKWLLIGSLTSSIINVILDYLFVLGGFGFPKCGVGAAAITTIVSMAVNLTILCVGCIDAISFQCDKLKLYVKTAKNHLIKSVPLMGQEILEGGVLVLALNSMITRLGTYELTSYLILQQFKKFLRVPMNMYGTSVLTLVSQNREKKSGLNKIVSYANCMVLIGYLAISAVYLSGRYKLPAILTENLDIRSHVGNLMGILLLFSIFHISEINYKNALQAMEQSSFVLYITAIVNGFILFFMFVFVIGGGKNVGIMICFEGLNAMILSLIYHRRYISIIRKTT